MRRRGFSKPVRRPPALAKSELEQLRDHVVPYLHKPADEPVVLGQIEHAIRLARLSQTIGLHRRPLPKNEAFEELELLRNANLALPRALDQVSEEILATVDPDPNTWEQMRNFSRLISHRVEAVRSELNSGPERRGRPADENAWRLALRLAYLCHTSMTIKLTRGYGGMPSPWERLVGVAFNLAGLDRAPDSIARRVTKLSPDKFIETTRVHCSEDGAPVGPLRTDSPESAN